MIIYFFRNGLFLAAAPEPSTSGLQASVPVPLASSSSIAEDGYLGDCSSDGGNEKNFPMPPDTLKRLTSKRCSCHPAEEIFPPPAPLRPPLPDPPQDGDDDAIEPPAGIGFRNIQPEFFASSCGYQVSNLTLASVGDETYSLHAPICLTGPDCFLACLNIFSLRA